MRSDRVAQSPSVIGGDRRVNLRLWRDSDARPRIVFMAIAVLVSAAVGFAVSSAEAGQKPEASMTSTSLPNGWIGSEIVVVDGHPALFAMKAGSQPSPSDPDGGICKLFRVADDPLRLTTNETVSCELGPDVGSRV